MEEFEEDMVEHPGHYTAGQFSYVGAECIDIARYLPFSLGNAVKYVWRMGSKPGAPVLQDAQKARWYLCDFLYSGQQNVFPEAAAVAALLREPPAENVLEHARWSFIQHAVNGASEMCADMDAILDIAASAEPAEAAGKEA